MSRENEEIIELARRIVELEVENNELKKKLERARGVPAEVLVEQMTGGKRTEGYKDSHDVITKKGNRIEVKLSKVNEDKHEKKKRWVWDNILGSKKYEFLVLAGEKDPGCQGYPADLVYVFFLVPQSAVQDFNSAGNCVALNTNFKTVRRTTKARILFERYLIGSQEQFKHL